MRRSITLLTRAGCHLCAETAPRVRRAARMLGIAVDVVDVDAAGLSGEYGSLVPVVLGPGGERLASGRIGTAALLGRLLRVRFGI